MTSFPLGVSDGWLAFEDERAISSQVAITLFGCGLQTCEILKIATNNFTLAGFSLTQIAQALYTSKRKLNRQNTLHVRQMIEELARRQGSQQT